MKQFSIAMFFFLALTLFSYADDSIVINNAWVREVPPGTSVSAAYMIIENKGDLDKLVGISSEAADKVELHTSNVDENAIATMEMIKVLEIPSDTKAELEPGGMHLMLIGLKESLVGKQSVKLELEFSNAGVIAVEVPVKKSAQMDHHHH